eukprot:gb/GEZJ01007389.1/.p1 GENE.gb/GEZJ01007389.1/~~gb/GEZJ01007389.1/.p1  ORF type:complete len:121 (+),score=6.13 gb/GEZJ01007389.1/:382-744(+)
MKWRGSNCLPGRIDTRQGSFVRSHFFETKPFEHVVVGLVYNQVIDASSATQQQIFLCLLRSTFSIYSASPVSTAPYEAVASRPNLGSTWRLCDTVAMCEAIARCNLQKQSTASTRDCNPP